MKKILVCGMMLGLLTAVSWAQHGRAIARGPIAGGGRISSIGAPNAVNPSAVGMPHAGVLPSATKAPNAVTTTSKTPNTVKPNATFDPNASTVGSHAETSAPNRVMLPDAHTGPGPQQ